MFERQPRFFVPYPRLTTENHCLFSLQTIFVSCKTQAFPGIQHLMLARLLRNFVPRGGCGKSCRTGSAAFFLRPFAGAGTGTVIASLWAEAIHIF